MPVLQKLCILVLTSLLGCASNSATGTPSIPSTTPVPPARPAIPSPFSVGQELQRSGDSIVQTLAELGKNDAGLTKDEQRLASLSRITMLTVYSYRLVRDLEPRQREVVMKIVSDIVFRMDHQPLPE